MRVRTYLHADNFTTEDVRFLVDTNFMGTVNGMAAVLEVFKRRSCGHLAVVASLAGYGDCLVLQPMARRKRH